MKSNFNSEYLPQRRQGAKVGFRRVRFAHRSVSEYLSQRREGAKVTGRGPSSRANARDLRKISPFGRNDINSELSVFAPLREKYPMEICALVFA